MKKILFCIILLPFIAGAQAYSGPESVEFDYANNRWLIANKNNGTVISRDMNGVFAPFVSGMTSGPYGIEILGNTLYCCHNGGAIRGFDLTSGAQVFNLTISGASFLNGICSDGNNSLYVTDFTAKKIYHVNVVTSAYYTFVTGLAKSPNGIIYEGGNGRLVFVNWGTSAPIMAAALSDSSVSTLVTTAYSNIDGIAADAYGNYYISTWGGNAIRSYSNNFTSGPTTVLTGLTSPADLFYNTVTDTLAIPNSGTANNVIWLGFTTASVASSSQENFSVTVFPQPCSSNALSIKSTENITAIKIYDLSGRLVFQQQFNAEKQCREVKPELNLSNGIYLTEVRCGTKKSTKKIILAD